VFNVPEGRARLMLEHRVRPGLRFRAAFASGLGSGELVRRGAAALAGGWVGGWVGCARLLDGGPQWRGLRKPTLERSRPPAAHVARPSHLVQGGLGGLLLRLKQDGHGHVQLVGPPGTRGP
jgi:uncharacterized protein YidB (DUF937 family)